MFKIINGLKYDTESASEIATYSYLNMSDVRGYEETLYKTKKGAWFLYGHGGALSPYYENIPGGSCGGSKICLLTENEVKHWLLETDNDNIYLNLFSVDEG
jgi:hypothetical protein